MNIYDASRLPRWSVKYLLYIVRFFRYIKYNIIGLFNNTIVEYRGYQKSRPFGMSPVICYAPFRSMFFGVSGNVVACCLNRTHVLGNYPEQKIIEIWNGDKIKELRHALKHSDLSKGCFQCERRIASGNYGAVEAQVYDIIPSRSEFPVMLEFELSINCNLQCIMCTSEFSSSIGSKEAESNNRVNLYDDNFLEQLEDYIPHLLKAKFLGGEPFLIPIYYKIWERIIRKNPSCMILVQTNATVMNEKIIKLISQGKFRISISIESFRKETYEKIRLNADYEKVMENIRFFAEYAKNNNYRFGISVCPIQQNWKEIPEIVENCNRLGAWINFNVVLYPEECTFYSLSHTELAKIIRELSAHKLPDITDNEIRNKYQFECLLSQLRSWYDEKLKKDEIRIKIKAKWEHQKNDFEKMTIDDMISLISMKISGALDSETNKYQQEEKRKNYTAKLKSLANEFRGNPHVIQILFVLNELPVLKLLSDLDSNGLDALHHRVSKIAAKIITETENS